MRAIVFPHCVATSGVQQRQNGEAATSAWQVIIGKTGMGRNKRLKERIATLRRRVQLHEDKKRREWHKETPDPGSIEHWQAEIDNWKKQIERAEQRLKKQR